MQKIKKAIQFGVEIKFRLEGNYIVNFVESNEKNDFVKVSYPFDSDQVEIDVTEDHVRILDKGKITINNADFENFKASIVNKKGVVSAILGFLNDALRFAERAESNKREIFVEVHLRTSEKKRSVDLNADNLMVDFNRIACNDVLIKSGNLTVSQGGLTTNTLKINSGNLRADLFFNSDNRKISIKSANGKIQINKPLHFQGLIKASGNNIKIDKALPAGSKDIGEFDARLNNGRIILVDI